MKNSRNFIDRTGQIYGWLTVLKYAGTTKDGRPLWFVECRCGTKKVVRGGGLQAGSIISCGCSKKQRAPGKTHGLSHLPEYRTWQSMKERCLKPYATSYGRYGAIGVKVCERWVNSFQSFFDDMGSKPSPKHSIDRWPEKNGNYEKSNCRWATSFEQQNNTRKNNLIVIDGICMSVSQWSRKLGISRHLVVKRYSGSKQLQPAFGQA